MSQPAKPKARRRTPQDYVKVTCSIPAVWRPAIRQAARSESRSRSGHMAHLIRQDLRARGMEVPGEAGAPVTTES